VGLLVRDTDVLSLAEIGGRSCPRKFGFDDDLVAKFGRFVVMDRDETDIGST